jgi:protein SCO1/2
MRRLWVLLSCAWIGAVALAGCDTKPAFNALDITGIVGYGSDFRLTDHTGKARSMADFRGKVVVLFFGYTQCPDVCPTTLSDMRRVMGLLNDDATRVQVLFVTVDPARDSSELLSRYVPAFHPTFLGLSGDRDATAKVTRDFKIIAKIEEGRTPESYTVSHTAASLVFDPAGRLRLFINYGTDPEKIAADIKLLLKGTS